MFVKVIVLCLYASLCLWSNEAATILPKDVVVPAVIAFGDSNVDSGNNNYILTSSLKANFPPYGKDFVGGNPTGRFSNGKTIADAFANALGVKEYLPAYLDPLIQDKDLLTGVSFASAGSGYDPLTTNQSMAISPATQLDMFKQYVEKLKTNVGEEAAKSIITNSVFLVVVAGNDLLISYFGSPGVPIRRFQYNVRGYNNFLVTLALDFLQELHNLGARRMAVFSAGILGCLPFQRTVGGGLLRRCVDRENTAAQLFNEMLKQELQQFKSRFPESKVALVDFYNPLISIIENPHKYGLEVKIKVVVEQEI